MTAFKREDQLLSLCGLNCGICPMHLDKYCPGCGGGAGNQPCAIARCSIEHGGVEYCWQCDAYPCEKYEGISVFDSFVTHRNQLKDIEKARDIGLNTYHSEQIEKIEILQLLLAHFNDGRRKSFFCLAVNLLDIQDLKAVWEQLGSSSASDTLTLKERAALAVGLLQNVAENHGILLKLKKKPSKR